MAVFTRETAPTMSCHASSIAECDDRLVVAWFGGEHERHPGVSIYISMFDGNAWQAPRQVASGSDDKGNPVACWNPVLFRPDPGPLMLFYKVGAEISEWKTWLVTSGDSGNTWSQPRCLGGGIEGPVRNKPIMIGDRMICPSSTEPSWQEWLVYFSLSEDFGETWKLVGPVNSPREFQAIQPTILQHPDGRLQALCRTREGIIAQTYSADGGDTWSRLEQTDLPNPNSGIDAVTLKDGRHVLVYNHTRTGRTPLNIAVSDDGSEWEMLGTLEAEPGEFSYPAVIQSADGMLQITYTNQRRTISHRALVV